ncbi:ATP-binding cassette sub-family C member 5-like [Diadema antillarum]|uniref:ATP-binding cassette sub-family C member 5-like n=1 Tax=Diadema antillarum TaxID=105358 RepID=UPI003A8A8485
MTIESVDENAIDPHPESADGSQGTDFPETLTSTELPLQEDSETDTISEDDARTHAKNSPKCDEETNETKTTQPAATKEDTEQSSGDNGTPKHNPWTHSSLLKILTLQWLSPLFKLAYKRRLDEADLYRISENNCAKRSAEEFSVMWEAELARCGADGERASLGRVALRFVWRRALACAMLVTVSSLSILACTVSTLRLNQIKRTISINGLLRYAEEDDPPAYRGVLYAVSAAVFMLTANTCMGLHYFYGVQNGARLRGAVVACLFERVLRQRGLRNKSVGEVVNVCINDGNRLYEGVVFTPLIGGGPAVFICACAYLVSIMGPSAFVGMAIYAGTYILQFYLTFYAKVKCRKRMVRQTDRRVEIINEMLTCIKFIKMYAWEDFFEKTIKAIRRKEQLYLACIGIMRGFEKALVVLTPITAIESTIMVHLALGNCLTPSMAFTSLAVIFSMRSMLTMSQFGYMHFSEMLVSIPRLKELLLADEVAPVCDKIEDDIVVVRMESVSAVWQKNDLGKSTAATNHHAEEDVLLDHDKDSPVSDGSGDSPREQPQTEILDNVSLRVEKGSLVGVCGSVASGKTSLLHTILGETCVTTGTVAVRGSIAYTAEDPVIVNATLRENILLFGDGDFDESRYREAIRVACLADDIEELPSGDSTEIGERGINLSGGQRHRVSLARAVYANRDVYLLDDPLNAVDTTVGAHIFEECIVGALRDKTVILVTNQLQFLKRCDRVIVIGNGRITEEGTHAQLMDNDSGYAALIRSFDVTHGKTADDNSNGNEDVEKSFPTKTHDGKRREGEHNGTLVVAENRESGSVSLKTFAQYCHHAGGYIKCIIALLLFCTCPASAAFSSAWLSKWMSAMEDSLPSNTSSSNTCDAPQADILVHPDFTYYRDIYSFSLIAVFVACIVNVLFYVYITVSAASNLHRSLLQRVFSSPMSFFDTTPSGRVLNRFSRDIDETDTALPNLLETFLWNSLTVVASVCVIIAVFPWFIIGVVIFSLFFIWVSLHFLPGIRDIKRIENVTRSPLLSHFKTCVEAQVTIRAFAREQMFLDQCTNLIDDNSSPRMLFTVGQRWLAFRLDFIVALAELFVGISVVCTHGSIAAAYAGLALSYSVQILGMLQFGTRQAMETIARFTSVERITDYINTLEREEADHSCHIIPENWPKQGGIIFSSIHMRYRPYLPLVLKDLSFQIHAGEKVGIVGRTGSGKSSIAAALFRLVKAETGRISIDGLDIAGISLRDLRSRISIIPQDPVLFIGTVRYNLDPYNKFSDDDIWDALEKTSMKEKVANAEMQLEGPVMEKGSNFSAGERQLLCLARTLLRGSKIIFLDEATATIDNETDSLIQATIRGEFADRTVLTIAHRLHTVLDSDRIMVLDSGHIVEMDTPDRLLADKQSVFSAMMSVGEISACDE